MRTVIGPINLQFIPVDLWELQHLENPVPDTGNWQGDFSCYLEQIVNEMNMKKSIKDSKLVCCLSFTSALWYEVKKFLTSFKSHGLIGGRKWNYTSADLNWTM